MGMHVVSDAGDRLVREARDKARPGEKVVVRVEDNRKGTGQRVRVGFVGGTSQQVSAAILGLNRDPRKW